MIVSEYTLSMNMKKTLAASSVCNSPAKLNATLHS